MTAGNNLTQSIGKGSLMKRILTGAAIGLALILALFLRLKMRLMSGGNTG